jgi:hypothetical protein
LKSNGINAKAVAVHEALARANFVRDVELLSVQFLRSRGWTVHEASFPVLDVTFESEKPLRVRLQCDDWNDLPPSVQLLNPDGSEWTAALPHPTFHLDKHPTTGRPFICMIGSREYHTHTSHISDHWANYKNQDGMNLPGLLDRFNRAWRKAMGLR